MAINGQAKASQQLNNIFGNGLNQRNAAAAVDTITTNQSQSTSQQTPEGPTLYKPLVITTDDNGNPLPSTDTLASTPLSITQDEEGNPLPPTAPSNTEPAAAAPNDDNFGLANTTSGTAAQLNVGTEPSGLIKPQPNILDQYASYTYSLSWYLLTPEQFTNMTNAKKLDITQWSLLVQSGGAATQQAGVSQQSNLTEQTASAVSGRNKYFSLDYYIDDFEITTTLGGGGPATLTQLSFKVTEPNGLTLLPNLTNAVRDFYQDTAAENNSAFYVMTVNFYGWDINGHLITDPTANKGVVGATPGVSNAVVTRYYPFIIAKLEFKMANKIIEYQITGGPHAFEYGQSTATGSIPYNIELTGETVKDILSGTKVNVFNETSAEDGRETTDAPSVITNPITISPQNDSAEVAALFNDGTGYTPGYDPSAGWSA